MMKTKCPNLEQLAVAIGSIDGVDSNKASPLCENIFDVQRNELFQVLARLRQTFWSDQVIETPEPTILPIQVNMEETVEETPEPIKSRKRVLPEPVQEPPKRMRSEPEPIQKPRTEKATYYHSLWAFKKLLIRHIKSHSEKDAIACMNQIFQTKSRDQCRHLSLYLLPVAKAMRKTQVVEMLNKKTLN